MRNTAVEQFSTAVFNGWGTPGGDAWERLGSNVARCAKQKKQRDGRKNGVKDERMRVQQVNLQLVRFYAG